MKFTDKNDFIVKYSSVDHYDKDIELFKIHCKSSNLHYQLERVNSFNKKKLDGMMLNELLNKVSPDDILNNRVFKTEEVSDGTTEGTTESNSELIKSLEKRINALEESNYYNKDEISDLRSELEDKDASIEDLQLKIEELENKSVKKKDETGGISTDSVE